MGSTEETIQRSYDAFRRGDMAAAVAYWDDAGELQPLPESRAYRGRDEIRFFLERDLDEREEFDIRVYTILEQADHALVFGRYSVPREGGTLDKGIFWIARVVDRKLVRVDAFGNVGEAMATFRERLGLVWA